MWDIAWIVDNKNEPLSGPDNIGQSICSQEINDMSKIVHK